MEINYEIKNLTELDKNILIEALDLLKEKYEETKLYYPSINGQDEKRDLILLTSTNGTKYKLLVDDSGNLSTEKVE